MAYRRRRASSSGYTRSRRSSGGYSRQGYSPRARRKTSRRAAPRETRIVIEVAPATPVSRPSSYLSALNPAFVAGSRPGKAKL